MWSGVAGHMYRQDSFFDLTPWGQVGLAGISTVLFLATLLTAYGLYRGRGLWARLPIALVLLWLFVWLSPQVYYTYYRMIIPDLPLQWVIWPPPGPQGALELLVFQGPQNLSAHSKGIMGWVLLAMSFVRLPTRKRS